MIMQILERQSRPRRVGRIGARQIDDAAHTFGAGRFVHLDQHLFQILRRRHPSPNRRRIRHRIHERGRGQLASFGTQADEAKAADDDQIEQQQSGADGYHQTKHGSITPRSRRRLGRRQRRFTLAIVRRFRIIVQLERRPGRGNKANKGPAQDWLRIKQGVRNS